MYCGGNVLGKRGSESVVGGNGVADGGGGAVRIVPGPGAMADMNGGGGGYGGGVFGAGGIGGRSAGLEYAKLKKEEAREGFKEKRRHELVVMGEGDRTKRRRKNDTTMSEDEKYRRRLKMNQDSAAAARYAQETYVATLEDLVIKFEKEKNQMNCDIGMLKTERMALESRIAMLQRQVGAAGPGSGNVFRSGNVNGSKMNMNHKVTTAAAPPQMKNRQNVAAQRVASSMSLTRPAPPPASVAAPVSRVDSNTTMMDVSPIQTMPGMPEMPEIPIMNSTNASMPTFAPAATDAMNLAPDGTNLKKMMDLYDPNFMLSLGLDDNTLDFSNDIIDVHPVA